MRHALPDPPEAAEDDLCATASAHAFDWRDAATCTRPEIASEQREAAEVFEALASFARSLLSSPPAETRSAAPNSGANSAPPCPKCGHGGQPGAEAHRTDTPAETATTTKEERHG